MRHFKCIFSLNTGVGKIGFIIHMENYTIINKFCVSCTHNCKAKSPSVTISCFFFFEIFLNKILKKILFRLELELPRLLAPDLPSNGSSLEDLKWIHFNYRTSKEK